MAELPDHVIRNRDYWSGMADQWVSPGRRGWTSPHINWGIWDVPESDVHALGDLGSWAGKDAIELGCGTAYFSSWLHRLGMNVTGIDITPPQLETARAFQKEFGRSFPLIEGSAECVPLPDASFDLALSEYGASIWCDAYKWIPEAARLLRPGGTLVFLRNSTLNTLCMPDEGAATETLCRNYFGMNRIEWDDGVEFHLPFGPMLRLLRANGFEVEDFIEVKPPADSQETRFEYVTAEWSQRWPSEEIWRAQKKV